MDPAEPLSASVIEDAGELEGLAAAWDALAVAVDSPFGAPAWALAWWRYLAPRGARLAVVAVHDAGELVGVAPFYAWRRLGVTELRLLSADLASRTGILAGAGREHDVAEAIARALSRELRPDALRWEGVDATTLWPRWLSASWPGAGAHRLQEDLLRPGPVLELARHPSFEQWLAARSRHFRRRFGRNRRALERDGCSFRLADRASLERDLASFERLHVERWRQRGGSLAVGPAAMAMLREVGAELIDSGRFRLWVIDGPDGEAVSAELLIAAGGRVASWNGGFDERWSRYSPGIAALGAAIEDAYARGDRELDLGGGGAAYKDRLADADRPVAWWTSFPRGRRYALARAWRLPEQTARRFSGGARALLGSSGYTRARRLLRRRS